MAHVGAISTQDHPEHKPATTTEVTPGQPSPTPAATPVPGQNSPPPEPRQS